MDGDSIPLPEVVIRHFRSAASIVSIVASVPLEVVSETFEDRSEYHQLVLSRITSRHLSPGIVFLDPDTGLQPRKATLEHVLDSEARDIWSKLVSGDVLVLYQHQTNRNGQDWVSPKTQQFERAIGIQHGEAKIAQSPDIARDVAFFYARKGTAGK